MRAIYTALFISVFFLIISFGFMPSSEVQAKDSSCSLALSFQGVRSNHGSLHVAFFNTHHNNFPDPKMAIKSMLIKPSANAGGKSLFLPCGTYALAVYHDENGNGKQDKNMLGMPTEGYAFSGNADTSFGPPDYDKAEFSLHSENQPLVIKLVYLFD